MELKPVIFVSYCQKHTELKDFFVQLIEAIGFQAEVFDAGSSKNVPETERELINKCDGFIGLLTPDEETPTGYLCSLSVTAEIAMAYSANKPLQLFAVDDVDLKAVQFTQVNTVTKLRTYKPTDDKSNLAFDAKNIRQIFRTFFDFKQVIDETYRQKWPSFDPTLLYKQFEIRQEILSSDDLLLRNSIEALTQQDLDTHTHAARLLCDRGTKEGITLRVEDFKFKLLKPVGYKCNIDIIDNGYFSFRFSINFQQPVPKGTPVKYAFERRHTNYFPYTREELEGLLQSGKLRSKIMTEKRMVGQDFYSTLPTETVRFILNFPKGYQISRYAAVACYGKGELIHKAETKRVEDLTQLNYDEFDEKYSLTLVIPNPHLHMTYLLLYEPPPSDLVGVKG